MFSNNLPIPLSEVGDPQPLHSFIIFEFLVSQFLQIHDILHLIFPFAVDIYILEFLKRTLLVRKCVLSRTKFSSSLICTLLL